MVVIVGYCIKSHKFDSIGGICLCVLMMWPNRRKENKKRGKENRLKIFSKMSVQKTRAFFEEGSKYQKIWFEYLMRVR